MGLLTTSVVVTDTQLSLELMLFPRSGDIKSEVYQLAYNR